MKKMLMKAMAVLTVLAISVSLTACGDDNKNDEPTVPESGITRVVVDYKVELSEDYFNLWDIEIAYTNAGGQTVTEKIDQDWNLEMDLLAQDEIPSEYKLTVTGKPKTPVPELDAEKLYHLNSLVGAVVSGYDNNGNRIAVDGNPIQIDLATKGVHLTELVTKDRKIASKTATIKLK